MKKIVRIITRLNIGGPAIHVILLSSEFNRAGYKDILVCGRTSAAEGDMLYYAKEKGVAPICVNDLGRDISFWKDIKAFFAILSIMIRERPDIVHTHTAKAGTLGRLAAIFAGVPVKVHTFHGHVFDGYFNPLKAKVFILIEKFLALFTDRVVVVSDEVKNDIVDKLKVTNRSKSVVIPLGLELENFLRCESRRGSFRKRFGLSDDMLLVGIVGRLVPIKNHRIFLDAAKQILDARPGSKVKFLVIGDGELGGYLKEYAKKIMLGEDVRFTGWMDDLPAVYSDLDIVALTSLNEGTPVSLIEAMASARPVVATSVGGVADIVRDGYNGLLAGSNDAGDFSRKLLRLIDDKKMRIEFGERGRELVREKYSKDRLVKDIKDLYEECLKNSTGR